MSDSGAIASLLEVIVKVIIAFFGIAIVGGVDVERVWKQRCGRRKRQKPRKRQ